MINKTLLAERLSIMTGVNESHILEFLDGSLEPDHAHLSKLNSAINDLIELGEIDERPTIDRHSMIIPSEDHLSRTTYGRLPEGSEMIYTSATEIMPGDMMMYRHNNNVESGQNWLTVETICFDDEQVVITFIGGYTVEVVAGHPVRVARASA